MDEWLALSLDAEERAIEAKNFWSAGWRAYHAGRVYNIRAQSAEVLNCADRAEAHWRKADNTALELPYAFRLRGLGYKLNRDLSPAIAAISQSLDLWRALKPESSDVAIGLNDLADAKRLSGDLESAEMDYREAIRISRAVNYQEGVVNSTGNFVEVLIDRQDWEGAELLAREALSLAESFGRQHAIGGDCHHLAIALQRQGKTVEALPFARRAVEILTKLGSRYLARARETLAECEPLSDNSNTYHNSSPLKSKGATAMTSKRFRIAFSFAGEKRDFVAKVADILAKQFSEESILYDKFHEAEFARSDLGIYLPNLYNNESDLVVVVICPNYDKKEWTGLEWLAIHDLLQQRKREEVLLCRFENAGVDGLFRGAGFIELDQKTPEQLATLILQRLALNEGHSKDFYKKHV